MALIECKKQELRAGESSRGTDSSDASIPYVLRYDAEPGDLTDVEDDVASTAPYVYGGNRVRKSIDIKSLDGTGLNFAATVKYETNQNNESEPDPLDRKDTYRFEASKETEAVFMTEDDDPVPIVTTAGEPFEKLQERTTGAFKLIIEGYREDVDLLVIAQYLRPNAVNDSSVTVRGKTFAGGELKFVNFSAEPVTENNVDCLKCKWECEIAPSWHLSLNSRGYWEFDPASEDIWPIVKGNPPQKVTKPWPLDEDGAVLPNADDTPFALEFLVQPERDFSVFEWTSAA